MSEIIEELLIVNPNKDCQGCFEIEGNYYNIDTEEYLCKSCLIEKLFQEVMTRLKNK